ncbi:hypothetical protein FA13DRAFT_1795757 [Coprinellus micaceus]|uniref:Uncharacterized protein n=1 Tax=Coprinellus micaceus TaxID=71717 RepID=A0A4Y7SYM9_COPMI|nr:hypothetical protein FA13DRAFT_1795757 [Coprinellus micaceus]
MTQLSHIPSDDDMQPPFTQRDPNDDDVPRSSVTGQPIHRLSDIWLRNPAYIDGARQPPLFFQSVEAIDEAIAAWGPRTGIWPTYNRSVPSPPDTPLEQSYALNATMARVTPTPIPTATVAQTVQGSQSATPGSTQQEGEGDGAEGPSASATNPDEYIICSSFLSPAPLVPGAKPTKKSQSTIKVFSHDLTAMSRMELSAVMLLVHRLGQAFHPGVRFRMYWAGSAGGKSGAASILTDADFDVNLAALFRKRIKPEVCVEFSSMDLEPFHIQEVAVQNAAAGVNEEELIFGTQVPQVSSFTTNTQFHGVYIMELKKKHRCDQHCGEHGEPGYCYVAPDGTHVRLNMHRLRLWAAAWAAGEATKYQPPNTEVFDSPRNGVGTGSTDLATLQSLVVAALLPTVLAGKKRVRSPSLSPRHYRTPPRASTSHLSPPLSPLPPPGTELEVFLAAFNAKEGINFTSYVSAFEQLDLTPDVIPSADTALIADICMTTIGKALKLKIFGKKWSARFARKCTVS